MNLLGRAAEQGALNVPHVSKYILNTMTLLCAPVRDEAVQKLETISDPVRLLRFEPDYCFLFFKKFYSLVFFFFFFFFFFSLFGCTHGIWKFLGQGLNLSPRYGNAGSLTHGTRVGIPGAYLFFCLFFIEV